MRKIAVCITTYNSAAYLERCISSVLAQTYKDFRLIIVDDGSTDNTKDIIIGFSDERICYKKNPRNFGIAASRNECIKQLEGEEYVFFTDADCYVDKKWLENGLKIYEQDQKTICVNGKTVYVSEEYFPHIYENSHIQTDSWTESYQTCNISYKRIVFNKLKFDETNFNLVMEDIDFAIMVKHLFPDMKLVSTDTMKVTHQKKKWTISGFFKDTQKVMYIVNFIKKHGKNNRMMPLAYRGSILNKEYLLLSIFPLGIIYYIFKTRKRVSSWLDVIFVFLYVIKSYYYRFLVWKYAIKKKIFLI